MKIKEILTFLLLVLGFVCCFAICHLSVVYIAPIIKTTEALTLFLVFLMWAFVFLIFKLPFIMDNFTTPYLEQQAKIQHYIVLIIAMPFCWFSISVIFITIQFATRDIKYSTLSYTEVASCMTLPKLNAFLFKQCINKFIK